MRYLLHVLVDSTAQPTEVSPDEIRAWLDDLDARGIRIVGDRLRPVAETTTVRRSGSDVLVADGPHAAAKEWVAGFDVLECRDLAEAIEIAGRHPMAPHAWIELREFWPLGLATAPAHPETAEVAS